MDMALHPSGDCRYVGSPERAVQAACMRGPHVPPNYDAYCTEAGASLGAAVFGAACFGAALVLAACFGAAALATWLSAMRESSSAKAAAGSISPQPNSLSRSLAPSFLAVEVSTSRMVEVLAVGWRSSRSAATPLTCAAATDVPVVS